MYDVSVTCDEFKGMRIVKQHKLVNEVENAAFALLDYPNVSRPSEIQMRLIQLLTNMKFHFIISSSLIFKL